MVYIYLDSSLVIFLEATFLDGHRLYQDNDPKHTSRWVQWYFKEKEINWWHTPPESPDLNPVELVWGSMKEAIRNNYKPRTLPDLEEAVLHYWRTNMTPEVCSRYVSHIHRVLPAVVENQGQASGF